MLIAAMVVLVFAQHIQISQQQAEFTQQVVQENQTEDSETENEPIASLDVDSNIIASTVQFHVNHVFYEIMDIVQDEEEDDFENTELSSLADDYRKVLFCQVISPNAP